MATRWDMVQAGRDALALKVMYIFGAKPHHGQFPVLSRSDIDAMRNLYGEECVWPSDSNKAGHPCCDCSGLITKATGVYKGSSQFYEEALERVPVSEMGEDWNRYIGWALWLPGHIGIVSDKVGFYYALDGSSRNSVHYPMSFQSWQYAIKISEVDYEEVAPSMPSDNLQLWDVKGISSEDFALNQRWAIEDAGDGYVTIRNQAHGKVLDASGGIVSNGTDVIVWKAHGGDNQKWKLIEVTNGLAPLYYISSAIDYHQVLDCTGGHIENGTKIEMWEANAGLNQMFALVPINLANNEFFIVNAASGRCLDLPGGGLE